MKPRGPTVPLIAVAGWLFADLLLVFFIVSLGAPRPYEEPEPEPTPTPTPEPTPEPSLGLDREPVEVEFQTSVSAAASGDDSAVQDLRDALEDHEDELGGREAGMVLTFGGTQNGTALAADINDLLTEADPELFAGSATREFHDLAASSGSVAVEIYLFTTEDSEN